MELQELIKSILQEDFLNKALMLSVAGGIVTAAIMYGRKLFSFVYGRISRLVVFSVRVEQTDELFWYLERWLFDNYKHKYRSVIAYTGMMSEVDNCKTPEVTEESGSEESKNKAGIKLRQETDVIVIKYKGTYIKISKGRDKLENASSMTSLFFDSFRMTSLFSTEKMKSLLKEVEQYSLKLQEKNKSNKIYSFDGYHWNQIGSVITKTIDNVFLPDGLKKSLISDVESFLESYDWYKRRNIPYKRGYLFYGPPGNGKTTLALALSRYIKRDICILNLSEINDDNGLTNAFYRLKDNSILLLEDVDVVFDKKRKLNKEKASFSTLLNCLDGVFYKEGIIVIMTTNCIEKLDAALIRAGRIDMKFSLDNPTTHIIKEYIDNFYGIDIELNGEVDGKGLNMADVQNICLGSTEEKIKKELASL